MEEYKSKVSKTISESTAWIDFIDYVCRIIRYWPVPLFSTYSFELGRQNLLRLVGIWSDSHRNGIGFLLLMIHVVLRTWQLLSQPIHSEFENCMSFSAAAFREVVEICRPAKLNYITSDFYHYVVKLQYESREWLKSIKSGLRLGHNSDFVGVASWAFILNLHIVRRSITLKGMEISH